MDLDDGYEIGEFKDGNYNGHVTSYRPNGSIGIESDWIDDKQHGHRTEFNPDGSIKAESDWINGVKQ